MFDTEEELQKFFLDYADSRGLTGPADSGELDIGYTPLLGKGERNWWNHVMTGDLPGGLQGVMARFTFEWHYTDNDGHRELHRWATPMCVGRVPFAIGWPHIYCHRHTFGGGGVVSDVDTDIAEKTRLVRTESAAMGERYDIRITPDADEARVRRLFDPVLIDWLASRAPAGFAFELYDGAVAGWSTEVEDVPEQLDSLAEATSAVARRLDEEARESAPPTTHASMAEVLATGSSGQAKVLATFEIDEPAEDGETIRGFLFDVAPDGDGEQFQARVGNRTPADMLSSAVPGVTLPVRYDPANRQVVAVDWAALRASRR
jgi:hypothetical protein